MTDVDLGTLARDGDVQALAGLLERHRPSLYAAAIRLLGNRADALDAVQETSLIALVRLADLRDPAAAKPWLHAVLRNVCMMQLRQRRELPTDYVELTTTTPSPEELLEEHGAREWIWQAIDSLSAEERLTVILRHFTRCRSYDVTVLEIDFTNPGESPGTAHLMRRSSTEPGRGCPRSCAFTTRIRTKLASHQPISKCQLSGGSARCRG